MNRWFRAYESALDDPKIQRLSGDLFKSWFNLLCLACRHDGVLPPICDIAFALRKSEKDADKALSALIDAGLVDETDEGFEPHNWKERQYVSDTSYERVKRHRAKRSDAGLLSQWQPPPGMREAIYERDGHACIYCKSTENLTLDHRVPELRGGTNETDNLQTACRQCNASKRDLTHDEFVKRNDEEPLQKRPQNRTEQITEDRTEQKESERATRSGSRLPEDWQPSEADKTFAQNLDLSASHVAEAFYDYWHGVAGAKGRKADWSATWRNWCRREAANVKQRATSKFAKLEPAATVIDGDDGQWVARLRGWNQNRWWKPYDWGPEPGHPRCLVPPHLLPREAA